MKGFVTYLSSDEYFLGVLTLHKSWEAVESKYPFYCLVTKNIDENIIETLKQNNIKIIKSRRMQLPPNLIRYNKENCKGSQTLLENYFNKLIIYGLEDFDKLIYMDADMIMMQNIDHLFNEPHMSAVVDHYEEQRGLFNSAIMVIEPTKALLKRIYTQLTHHTQEEFYAGANKHHHCLWDQDYLNMFFSGWWESPVTKLNADYNVFTYGFSYYQMPEEDVKVAHLVRKKPWLMSPNEIYHIVKKNENGEAFMYKKFLYYLSLVMADLGL